MNARRAKTLTYLSLLIIVCSGLILRTWNINFDKGVGSHPDERSTVCFHAPRIKLPASWDEFKDPQRSPMNPLWNLERQARESFTYGHFPLYLGILTGNVLTKLAPLAEKIGLPQAQLAMMQRATEPCNGIAIAGRLTIALLDTLTILLLFFLGRRMVGPRGRDNNRRRSSGALVGLLAAGFYAFTAQAIQLSHFFAMDPASTTFTVLAVLGGVMMVQDRSPRAIVITGIGLGLAISSKFSALPLMAVPITAAILIWWQSTIRANDDTARSQLYALVSIPATLLIGGLAFLLTSPYAVLDYQSFLQATLVEQGRMVRGIADFPFTRQYRNTTPYLYFIQQQMAWGLGWPLGLVAAAGTLAALAALLTNLWRLFSSLFVDPNSAPDGKPIPRGILNHAQMANIVVWSWLLPYFGLTGAFLAKFNRYMLPALPFVLLFAATLIGWLWEAKKEDEAKVERKPRLLMLSRAVALLLIVVGLGGGLFWSAAYVNGVYNTEHPWITASRWVYENVERDSIILWEQWDDPIPKALPGEPGMDMGSAGLRHIDWGPYEDDTAQKFELLKSKLREADYVIYSSKRIYDSVDELPERYPMTTRYYDAMWSGDLGYELALDVSTPPALWGYTFEDRKADESWSLYDHPQVTIFRKTRDLSDAEYDALFDHSWERAIQGYRGKDSPISPFLDLVGLGNSPQSENSGAINRVVRLLMGTNDASPAPDADTEERLSLLLEEPVTELPVVDNYRWNRAASDSPLISIAWWWLVMALLGWLSWPLTFGIFRSLRDRGYLLSRTFGWLLAGWFLWLLVSFGWALNSVANAWLTVLLLGLIGAICTLVQWRAMRLYIRQNWGLLLAGEALFTLAFLFFVYIRMGNPDLWQPWNGGEKFMEFAFLNGILRSPTFPPVDPHFAGGYINYYYFGLYLVTFMIKLTGIYAEVAFNLAIPMLFALTVANSFSVAYSAIETRAARVSRSKGATSNAKNGEDEEDDLTFDTVDDTAADLTSEEHEVVQQGTVDSETSVTIFVEDEEKVDPFPPRPQLPPAQPWRKGFGAALLAPLFVVLIGNLDGFAQIVRRLTDYSSSQFESSLPMLQTVVHAASGLRAVVGGEQSLPGYDFWAPSRVIPFSINEFPYWSFLFADLHPHLIGIPFAALFLALLLVLILDFDVNWGRAWGHGLLLLFLFGLLLGTMASVNLWELPTYFGLAVLALLISQFRRMGRVSLWLTGLLTAAYGAVAYATFWPFFSQYTSPAIGGVGLVREPDPTRTWLLIWGFLGFVLVSWLLYAAARPARVGYDGFGREMRPSGIERWLSMALRFFGRLPRFLYLHRLLVRRASLGYLLGSTMLLAFVPLALLLGWLGYGVLALCLVPLAIGFLLLWRRGRGADGGSQLAALLAVTGLAILAGTQLIYLKDFLQGGEWYRMNTLFKFFSQVWVLWGVAAAIALPRFWNGVVSRRAERESEVEVDDGDALAVLGPARRPLLGWQSGWAIVLFLLLLPSLAFIVFGTAARLDNRFPGWRPDFGTLNGLAFMEQGVYQWPDANNPIELGYDLAAIEWILDNVQGNAVIVESAQVDYYRAAGTRVASMTGLSGLRGMHEGEQRYGDQVGARDGLHHEFWSTPDWQRTQDLIDQLDVTFIYVGQLERHQHPEGTRKMEEMAAADLLVPLYENDRTVIYGVATKLAQVIE